MEMLDVKQFAAELMKPPSQLDQTNRFDANHSPGHFTVGWSSGCWWLLATAVVQLALYVVIAWLSRAFDYHADLSKRPIPLMLGLFWINFAIHLLALRIALAVRHEGSVICVVVLGAIAFRAVMILSQPIQEIDIYRYCWDGAVLRNGVSPFLYSPERVRIADKREAGLSKQLERLVALRDYEPGMAQILGRVHHAELTTIYPPVSQAVFAIANLLTPPGASLASHVLIMKTVIVMFDMGVLVALSQLLIVTGMRQGWLISYAWCPLILKEFANSGHLDAIAVCFTVFAMLAFARGVGSGGTCDRRWLLVSSASLALGVGAKLYPLVLLPLLVVTVWAHHGWKLALKMGVGTGCLTLALLSPMLSGMVDSTAYVTRLDPVVAIDDFNALPLRPSTSEDTTENGLTAFLSRWQMNDLLFMIVEENLKPNPVGSTGTERPAAWFVVVPNSAREFINRSMSQTFGVSKTLAPFLLARVITLAVFATCLIWFCYRATSQANAHAILENAFLTLAWFWLLAPTQNPWYWSWALPFVAFAKGRIWLAVSCLALIYYLRFWCLYHFAEQDIWLAGYPGARFFDFVVVWFEFGPLFVALLIAYLWRRSS